MVCTSCEAKLSKVCVPDKWKDGSRNTIGAVKAGKTNKALAGLKSNAAWVPSQCSCRICKTKVQHQMNYCNDCAHKRGICAMCGKKAVDVSAHRMSLT